MIVLYLFHYFTYAFAWEVQLVVIRADLNGHLKALKDYFLLAKGDFFQVTWLLRSFVVFFFPLIFIENILL